MVDIRRHAERLLVSGSIVATGTLTSATWNVSKGQKFNVALEALAGTSPEIDIDLHFCTGLNGGGLDYTLSIATAVSAAPSTPYGPLDTDDYIFKSAYLVATGTASNHATDTTATLALMVY